MTNQPSPGRPDTVYYFPTCLIDLFYPEAGLAGIELLQRAGTRVVMPNRQSCCGQPARNCGYYEEARSVARAQIAAFPNDWPIVVPSGSCAGMMKVHYPDLFKGTTELPKVNAFCDRVYELTWFLVHVMQIKLVDKGEPIKVTWHGSCHSMRETGVVEEPKDLIRSLRNVTLVEADYEKECCGFGGTFAVRMPELSGAIVGDKVANINATGAARVLSGDMGCMMNIAGALRKANSPVKGSHIAEFLLERIGKGEAP
jgi:L-lactate dehydrogenase complex protein LldE